MGEYPMQPSSLLLLLMQACPVLLPVATVFVEGCPAKDLVVRLLGQPNVGFFQFAGYVNIDLKAGQSLFYNFVEVEGSDPAAKPLAIWLNGVNVLSGGCVSYRTRHKLEVVGSKDSVHCLDVTYNKSE